MNDSERRLRQLCAALANHDALYDIEEYLRSELAAHPDKPEGDVLELIASTYGAFEEVATAYRETEAEVNASATPPGGRHPRDSSACSWTPAPTCRSSTCC